MESWQILHRTHHNIYQGIVYYLVLHMGKVRILVIDETKFASLADNDGHENHKTRVHLQEVNTRLSLVEGPLRLSTWKQGRKV